jgi:hypothetical protein
MHVCIYVYVPSGIQLSAYDPSFSSFVLLADDQRLPCSKMCIGTIVHHRAFQHLGGGLGIVHALWLTQHKVLTGGPAGSACRELWGWDGEMVLLLPTG